MLLPFPASSARSKQVGLLCRISGLVLCFSVYYAFYFMNFSEGSLQGSHLFLYTAKALGLTLLALGFAPYWFEGRLSWPLWAFIGMNALFLTNYLIAHHIYSGGDSLFLNQILFLPFCVLLLKTVHEPIIETMDILLPLLLIQILIDAILEIIGKSLWQNLAFTGGLGNPNSFGLCLVFLLIYIWTIRGGKFALPLSIILMTGALLTQSLMIAVILFLLPVILYALERDLLRLVKREGLYTVIFAICSYTNVAFHVNRKILAILHKFGLASYDVSIGSVDGRLDQIQYVVNAISLHNWLRTFFFGHDDGAALTPLDPQYLFFALNFGIIPSLAFATINLLFLALALRTTPKYRTFLFTALLAFNFSFLTNRLLAYFPMGFLYMLIIASILKYTSSRKRLESAGI